MRSVASITILATAAALGAVMAAGQAPGQIAPGKPVAQFATRVDLVMVDVSVLDDDRHPVRGLTDADFTILENGVPQTIQTFSAIDLPDVEKVSAPWIRDVAPDVIQNDDMADRRIVAIVLDDALPMNVGDGAGNPIAYVKRAASEVVNQLGPRDLAAVIFPLDKSGGQDFTSDRARLLKAIERYNGNTGFGLADGPGITATRQQYLYQSLLSTVRMLAEYLAELPDRRKALILATEGIPLDVEAMMPQIALGEGVGTFSWPQLLAELHDTFLAAQRANVNIYPIDPGGLRTDRSNAKVDFLRSLAETTGGYAVVDTNDTAAGVRQIFRENGSYYLLGYAPSSPRMEGRFRKIQVKVSQPRLTVRARTGYIEPRKPKAASTPAPSPIWKALASPMPRGDIVMHATAAPFAVPGRREGAVAIVAGLHQPAPPGTDRVVEHADLIVNAYDPKGDRRGSERVTMRVVLRPGRGERGGELPSVRKVL
jgi:VWFA-related protein